MIPDGQETRVLLRHGFQSWNQLYPRRQLAVTEAILSGIDEVANDFPTRSSLQMAVYGASEMAGHLSRWDRWYLKSYEAMANHRFNLTTFAVEPNIWGVPAAGRGTIQRRLSQMAKAAEWLASRKESPIRVEGPLDSGGAADSTFPQHIDVRIVQGSSERMLLPDATAHLVLTDPPYHDDVQYGELSSLFRAWAQLPAGCLAGEAVVNEATGQNAEVGAYQDLLTKIFSEAQRVLRSDGHLVLSYANREPLAWIELLNGFQRAGFRAVGYTIVHSENETDHAKRGVRACNLDLIMDLVPQGGAPTEKWHAQEVGNSPEAEFLGIVGSAFLDVGALHPGWETSIISRLGSSRFLKGS
jgi:adenine-specific DNA methylase